MHIKSLKIFCDTVALRSFSKAAEENGVSQSNASQVIHQLEERLGVELIDRSTRPFRVTPEGERYFEGCKTIVRKYDDLEREVRTLHEEVASRVTIAAIYSVGLADMSHYLDEFRARYPRAAVRIEYLHPKQVHEAVESEEADLGIVSYPAKSRRLAALDWRDEPWVIVCAPDHALASQSNPNHQPATVRLLADQAFVAFDRGLLVREKLDRLLAREKVDVQVELEFDNIETMKRAIETGAGVSLLPEPTVRREVAAGSLAMIRLADSAIVRPLGIIHRRDREMSDAAQAFVELLQTRDADTKSVVDRSAMRGAPSQAIAPRPAAAQTTETPLTR